MKEKMKVHAFGVKKSDNSGDLKDLLEHINGDSLEARIRKIGFNDIRIENIKLEADLWYFDFGKFRDRHGPGKASKSIATKGFDFQDGEVFCEETACLYIPKSNHLIVQYNHHGTRVGLIQSYLSSYDENNSYSFEMLPKYDETVEQKFRNRVATKKITFQIDPRYLNQNDKDAGVALTQALDIGKKSDGEKVELTISAGSAKENRLSNGMEKALTYLKEKAHENPKGITKLRVGVLEDFDSKMEVLDLIEHRLVHEFSNIKLGKDLRFSREERYGALTRASKGWKNILQK